MTQQGKSKDRFPLNCNSLERKKTGQDQALGTHNMSGTHHGHFSPRHQRLISRTSYKIKQSEKHLHFVTIVRREKERKQWGASKLGQNTTCTHKLAEDYISSRIHPPWENHCKSILSKSQNSRHLLVTWNRILERTLLVVSNGCFIFKCEFFIFFCKAVQALN